MEEKRIAVVEPQVVISGLIALIQTIKECPDLIDDIPAEADEIMSYIVKRGIEMGLIPTYANVAELPKEVQESMEIGELDGLR